MQLVLELQLLKQEVGRQAEETIKRLDFLMKTFGK